jgi:hypothetical protein
MMRLLQGSSPAADVGVHVAVGGPPRLAILAQGHG